MDHLFHHVYPDLNQVLNVCRLTSWQKYAVLRQGVTSTADVCMVGAMVETIHDNFKHFNSLTKSCGSTDFGAIPYTCIHPLTEYVHDQQCQHGQLPDPAAFTNRVMNECIERSGVNEQADDKLGENNFHQWVYEILAQLCAKKGNNHVPLAYVVWKPTPPQFTQTKRKGSSMYTATETYP